MEETVHEEVVEDGVGEDDVQNEEVFLISFIYICIKKIKKTTLFPLTCYFFE